jgi:hypothetical protein
MWCLGGTNEPSFPSSHVSDRIIWAMATLSQVTQLASYYPPWTFMGLTGLIGFIKT